MLGVARGSGVWGSGERGMLSGWDMSAAPQESS